MATACTSRRSKPFLKEAMVLTPGLAGRDRSGRTDDYHSSDESLHTAWEDGNHLATFGPKAAEAESHPAERLGSLVVMLLMAVDMTAAADDVEPLTTLDNPAIAYTTAVGLRGAHPGR
ncbi:MAG: hypothetical protein R3B91_19530 [Planctomycetaceae bacterium]